MDPDTIRRLAEQANAEVAAAWLAAMAGIRDARSLSELAALLEAGRIDEAMSVFGPNISTLSRTWNNVFVRAGQETADQVQDALRTAGRGEVVLDFNMVNDGAVRAMQENNLRLVREFTDQQRRATRDALLDGVQRGANPREQARNFRRSIGLTQRQQRAVANFERLLRNNDPAALNRALRDRRFDRSIQRAIREGQPLTNDQITRMVDRYRSRMIAHRAEVIARTESLRAVHQGQHEAMRQAVESGTIAADQIIREWNSAGDERVRDFETGAQTSHRTMNGQVVRGLETPFISGAGNALLYPTDPNAPGYDTIQCRCAVGERLDLNAAPGVRSVQVIDEL